MQISHLPANCFRVKFAYYLNKSLLSRGYGMKWVFKSIDHSMYVSGFSSTPVVFISVITVVFSGDRRVPLSVVDHIVDHSFKDHDLQMFGLKLNKYMSNFQPLEVVGRGNETQLEVVENLNSIASGSCQVKKNNKKIKKSEKTSD